jgi:hypothetical protein
LGKEPTEHDLSPELFLAIVRRHVPPLKLSSSELSGVRQRIHGPLLEELNAALHETPESQLFVDG